MLGMIQSSYVVRYTYSLSTATETPIRKLGFYANSCNHLMHFHCYAAFRKTLKDKVCVWVFIDGSMRIQMHFIQRRSTSSFALFVNS
jgi:hypothetical protein